LLKLVDYVLIFNGDPLAAGRRQRVGSAPEQYVADSGESALVARQPFLRDNQPLFATWPRRGGLVSSGPLLASGFICHYNAPALSPWEVRNL
jgi:hypothetical protein